MIVAWSAIRRPDVPSLLFGCGLTVVLTCCCMTCWTVLDFIPDDRIFFSRLSYSALLVAIGAGLTWRFARALNRSTALPAAS